MKCGILQVLISVVQVASPKSASGRFKVSSVSVSVSASVSVPSDSAEVFSPDFVSVSAVLSGHDGGARRGTDGASGVCLRKSHALLCHLVDAGRLDERLTVASQVAVSHVVAENEQDVGFFRIGRCSLCMRCSHGNQSHTVG